MANLSIMKSKIRQGIWRDDFPALVQMQKERPEYIKAVAGGEWLVKMREAVVRDPWSVKVKKRFARKTAQSGRVKNEKRNSKRKARGSSW